MTRYRFYVDWINAAGDLETSGHIASGPAEAYEIQKHFLHAGERIEAVRAKPDMVAEGREYRLLTEPEATEIEARFKTEAEAVNDTIAAIRAQRAFNAAIFPQAAE